MLIIPEIGINHDGSFRKAMQLVWAAHQAGARCVKFQCHIPDDEMIPQAKTIIPSNATENIYDMMARCAFSEEQERALKKYTESLGMLYLSTPFSRAAADRLNAMGVKAFKIGSGECNNIPLIRHIASFGKPVILSTGMNDDISEAVQALRDACIPFALLHCVSMYPTPYDKVNLFRMVDLRERYHVPVGLSDHSHGIYTALAAVALGAQIIEKHFTLDRAWPGADNPISITPEELGELIKGARAISGALHKRDERNNGERKTSEFAFASVVSTRDIKKGERFTYDNTWVKRPGGGIPARFYYDVLGCTAIKDIAKDRQIQAKDCSRNRGA